MNFQTNTSNQQSIITELLHPQYELEFKLIEKKEFVEGLFWGKPRFGHPEGAIINHIHDVLNNIHKIPNLSDKELQQLRLIAYIHDTFKHKEAAYRKLLGRKYEYSHAVLAYNFAKEIIIDQQVLDIILWHDEAYFCWQKEKFNLLEESNTQWNKLMENIKDCLNLYIHFFRCDTQTGGKMQEPLIWFEKKIKKHLTNK